MHVASNGRSGIHVRLAHSRVHADDCVHCDTRQGQFDRIEQAIHLDGDLSADQRARLMDIAQKCPVHRTIASKVDILTRFVEHAFGRAGL